ncbi:hypothetical protein KGB50_gp44 [Shigella phage DS8]|uniref:Uncharacterized protein n=1 Tax=Shigella phage DS8 TaxID=2565502 RepID=A0A4P8N3F0_9CAUD|nr:hypothetical protein KGB50_gp44 [Shigella phage DS8]QCQ57327.1 hypothetical protein [Shigella phage DS8]
MIIDETKNCYELQVSHSFSDYPIMMLTSFREGDDVNSIGIDKHQAAQLIEVLQRWVDGEEIE